jgi:hypothetical protein
VGSDAPLTERGGQRHYMRLMIVTDMMEADRTQAFARRARWSLFELSLVVTLIVRIFDR